MSWVASHRRTVWICGLTLLLPLFLYLVALAEIWGKRQDYQAEIDRLVPRVARLQGLVEFEQELGQSSDRIGSQLMDLVYPPTDDRAAIAAELQSEVREILTGAGMSVSNSQVLPPKIEESFDYVVLKFTVAGSIAGLDASLAEIAQYRPLLLVESIEVWPQRIPRQQADTGQQAVSASLELMSLRAVE